MSFSKKPKLINPEEVDPSVYYYDEVYDEMKDEAKSSKTHENDGTRKTKDRSAKYIQGLKETADLRQAEKELRKYKRYARDREEVSAEEGEDVYITPVYKEKLKQLKRLEDEKIKRLQAEKDNYMNFQKKSETSRSTRNEASCKQPIPTTSSEPNSEEVVTNEDLKIEKKQEDTTKIKRRELRTLDDRREYLRELLAKRTVGKAYEEAIERYIARKAKILAT